MVICQILWVDTDSVGYGVGRLWTDSGAVWRMFDIGSCVRQSGFAEHFARKVGYPALPCCDG